VRKFNEFEIEIEIYVFI